MCIAVTRLFHMISSGAFFGLAGSLSDIFVLDDYEALRVPGEAALGLFHWQPSIWKLFDSYAVAAELRGLCSEMMPDVPAYEGGPMGLSWWLAANLPSNLRRRQLLLRTHTVVERLSRALSWLKNNAIIQCIYCRAKVTPCSIIDLNSLTVNLHTRYDDQKRKVCKDAVIK